MCVHHRPPKDIVKQRKLLQQVIRERSVKNSIDEFDFLLSVEAKILELIEIYGQEIKLLLDDYYNEAAEYVSDGQITGWEVRLLDERLKNIMNDLAIETGNEIHAMYADVYGEEEDNTFFLLMLPFILSRYTTIGKEILNNTIDDIRDTIDPNDLTTSARSLRSKRNAPRAFVIASTEIGVAQSIAEYLTMERVNRKTPLKKYWVGVLDDRIRDSHFQTAQFYNRNNAIGFNEFFQVGDSLMKYPRDTAGSAKEVVGCRCYTAYVT